MKKCPTCGAEYSAGEKFCKHDGSLLVEATQKAKCVHCGAELDEGVLFCSMCGTKVGSLVENEEAEDDKKFCKVDETPTVEKEESGKKCPKCGRTYPDDAGFCISCGVKLVSLSEKNVCAKCGAELPDGAAFCMKCGTKVGSVSMLSCEMIAVEGGTFTMGDDSDDDDDCPEHEVTVSSFEIGKYQVTQELYESVMGKNPSEFKGSNRPVDSVLWYDAVEFCNKLSKKDGLEPCYSINKKRKDPNNRDTSDKLKWTVNCDFSANGYRLPTEAEWEFAARGGNESEGYEYAGSDDLDEVAWYGNNETQNVGQKKPNELGIYDMSGNVCEWCWDWYGDYDFEDDTDPIGASSGFIRMIRGGVRNASYCRVAIRDGDSPGCTYNFLGFRVVRSSSGK